MSLPPNLSRLPAAELADLLAQHVFETNLIVRALVLMGVPVNADLVDREDVVYRGSRPEIIMTVGHEPE